MAGELILVVDDENSILQLVRMYLEREGFAVQTANNGHAALTAVSNSRPALMVLDIMLPALNGLEVCRRLRAENDPILILMLTAKDEDVDKIVGLEIGADDYMTKPFNPRELVARVKALLRRNERGVKSESAPLRVGDLVIDPASREVTVKGKAVALRHQEFNLLRVLVEHKGIVLNRDQLLNLAWGYDFAGQTRTVDVHIGYLRKKLVDSMVSIETVTSDGYKLVI